MKEIIFVVEEAPEGGHTARALEASIFTEADELAQLETQVRAAVICHFEESERTRIIRLHFVREEVIAV
ncbi:MAG: 2-oxoisovalerate dehydrogenase [Thermoleophilia bacterium]|nr:2-oxoisovalerate dehydrogenase [Thermoleophilia bacterium]